MKLGKKIAVACNFFISGYWFAKLIESLIAGNEKWMEVDVYGSVG
jgi:hypothetical protein